MVIYVVDTCVFRELLFYVFRSVNPEIWKSLEEMLNSGEIISVKEVYRELELQLSKDNEKMAWLNQYKNSFNKATDGEANIIKMIYANRNFQNGVTVKNILTGKPVADAFIIAKAKILGGIVVTREEFKPNSASIPNICKELNVKCIGVEEFQILLKSR